MVKIENLHKSFGDVHVLKGIDLEVRKGEVVSIIGPSGTGKSTLLRCINFLERPEQGKITIGDITIDSEHYSEKDVHELRKHSAMIFQNYNLFANKDALHNVMEPLTTAKKMKKEEAEEIARKYLRKVGMEDLANKYPITLSGGQQQRVAIARSMAVQPAVLLLDEPTSALDPEWVHEVLDVIEELAEEHFTMIIVTHEIQFAEEVSDRVVFMENGYIVEQGTPAEILENSKNPRTREFLKKEERSRYKIIRSRAFEDMVPMFIAADLEMSPDEKTPDNLITCLELIDRKTGERVGGASIVYQDNTYVLRTLCVDEALRGQQLGTRLVDEAISIVNEHGGKSIWLSAKVGEFYRKLGFVEVDRADAPDISDCFECSRFGKTCNAEIMKYEWE